MNAVLVLILLLVPPITQAEYLGDLSANPFGSNSTTNPFWRWQPAHSEQHYESLWSIWQSPQSLFHDQSLRH